MSANCVIVPGYADLLLQRKDPSMTSRQIPTAKIAFTPYLKARLQQLAFPLMMKLFLNGPTLQFATRKVAAPKTLTVRTRHGDVNMLVYAPAAGAPEYENGPPVHVITHGGGFYLRHPEQEDNVARYLASETGCYVVLPDYHAAPQVQFPVAEEETYDCLCWVRANAAAQGWDGNNVSVGGGSAGTKLAVSLIQQALDAGEPVPVALSCEYGVIDMSRPNSLRTSPLKSPMVSGSVMDLVRATYYTGLDLKDPFVSPIFEPRLDRFPPTLILNAAHDSLLTEMEAFSDALTDAGVAVTTHCFPGVDHAFTHFKPVETARQAIEMIGNHLATAYRQRTTKP